MQWLLLPAPSSPAGQGNPGLWFRVTQVPSLAPEGAALPHILGEVAGWEVRGRKGKSVLPHQPCLLGVNEKPFKVDYNKGWWGALGCIPALISAR